MARRNGCTGETEYPNGCTFSGYALSTVLTLMLCVVVPVLHHFRFSNAPPSPLDACLSRAGLTPESHAAALSMYFRYEVKPQNECTFETRILRGCVEDRTARIGFVRYPPGPLRTKNKGDVYESFEYISRDFTRFDDRTVPNDDACARPGAMLATTLPRLMSAPYNVALRDIPPFSKLHTTGSNETAANISYHHYACLASVERGVRLIESALAGNKAQTPDLSTKLAHFFADPQFVPGLCHLADEKNEGNCPGEKDTREGSVKGSDDGLGACDFVEYANVV